MPGHRPQPMTAGDEYLAMLLDELVRQGEVLADIRDRLPEPADDSGRRGPAAGPATVELREPVKPSTAKTPAKPAAKRGGRRT